MKPFPEAIQKAFPLAHTKTPERPWWRPYRMGVMERIDGAFAAIDKMEHVDAEDPLPHPGYRVGQIWCSDRGDCQMVTHSDEGTGERLTEFGYVYLVADLTCPNRAPWAPSAMVSTLNSDRAQLAQLEEV